MTPPGALCRLSAVDAARQVAARELSPIALVDAVLARLAEVDPTLGITAAAMDAEARAAAERAQAALDRGETTGPLHGIPITVKDNIAVAGVALRHGSAAPPPAVPTADALLVRRLKAAGAIVVGKTTLPEFAHKVLTDNPVDGITRNPWNTAHTPGGSSGGASAALAAGAGPLALGTDGGGSIRCPASCTGSAGLKATLGRIPNETAPDAFGNFFFAGPMARTAADLRLLLSVLEGSWPGDPFALAPPPTLPITSGRPLRIGWVPHFGAYQTQAEVAEITGQAVERLASTGASIVSLRPDCFLDLFSIYQVLATAAHATRFGHLATSTPCRLTPSMQQSIEIGHRWSAIDLLRAQDRRTALFRAVQALFEDVDVIATPTLTAPPPLVDAGGSIATEWYGEWAAPLYPFNMTGHPALSTPAGFTAYGLPVGLQLVGPWHADLRLLDVAETLEMILDLPTLAGAMVGAVGLEPTTR